MAELLYSDVYRLIIYAVPRVHALRQIAQTCRSFRAIVAEDELWKLWIRLEFGARACAAEIKPPARAREIYVRWKMCKREWHAKLHTDKITFPTIQTDWHKAAALSHACENGRWITQNLWFPGEDSERAGELMRPASEPHLSILADDAIGNASFKYSFVAWQAIRLASQTPGSTTIISEQPTTMRGSAACQMILQSVLSRAVRSSDKWIRCHRPEREDVTLSVGQEYIFVNGARVFFGSICFLSLLLRILKRSTIARRFFFFFIDCRDLIETDLLDEILLPTNGHNSLFVDSTGTVPLRNVMYTGDEKLKNADFERKIAEAGGVNHRSNMYLDMFAKAGGVNHRSNMYLLDR